MKIKKLVLLFAASLFAAASLSAEAKTLSNNEAWKDTSGEVIQAHDTVVKVGSKYYWYGLDYSHEKAIGDGQGFRSVKCYESEDLVNWTFKNNVLTSLTNDFLLNCDLWYVQVVYNAKTKMYVMWTGTSKGTLVFVSDKPYGNFHMHNTRFNINAWAYVTSIFVDTDGAAYAITECLSDKSVDVPAFMTYRLTDDYLELRKDWNDWGDIYSINYDAQILGRSQVIKHKGVYYLIVADYGQTKGTGYSPTNPVWYGFVGGSYSYQGVKWAYTRDLSEKWSGLYSFEDNTSVNCEFSNLIDVVGKDGASVIAAFNGWNKNDLSQSRYTWQPLKWDDSNPRFIDMDVPYIGDYSSITIDAEKGSVEGN